MQPLPPEIIVAYDALLADQQISDPRKSHLKKWLRFYLDYCYKYHAPPRVRASFSAFYDKLKSKNQSDAQCQQAEQAVSLYYGLLDRVNLASPSPPVQEAASSTPDSPPQQPQSQATGASWVWVYEKLDAAIKVRHYSPKTLKVYRLWMRRFQEFTKSKSPELLSMDDVKGFLSSLAVEKKVAASTQNQAFNALLFLFRHLLEKPFEKIEGVVRAKRKKHIPVVLSRDEVDSVLAKLRNPYLLAVQLVDGCGMRLFECLKLRV